MQRTVHTRTSISPSHHTRAQRTREQTAARRCATARRADRRPCSASIAITRTSARHPLNHMHHLLVMQLVRGQRLRCRRREELGLVVLRPPTHDVDKIAHIVTHIVRVLHFECRRSHRAVAHAIAVQQQHTRSRARALTCPSPLCRAARRSVQAAPYLMRQHAQYPTHTHTRARDHAYSR
jgi:hypothetical protein